VREPQEPERLWLRQTALCSALGGEPPELDQPRLLRVQLQGELRKPLAKVGEEPLGIVTVLEAGDPVVGLCRVPSYAEPGRGSQ